MKAAIFIDGGHLRFLARQAGYRYDPNYIEAVALACVAKDESLLRVLYYDCAPYQGNPKLPVSGEPANLHGSDEWLKVLSAKPQFAVRLGVLKFRGFVPRRTPVNPNALSDADFKPQFEQKGVDMRLGLDIASYAANRSLDRIILITGDTDCLPAMKMARIAGLQVVTMKTDGSVPQIVIPAHAGIQRPLVLESHWTPAFAGVTALFSWLLMRPWRGHGKFLCDSRSRTWQQNCSGIRTSKERSSGPISRRQYQHRAAGFLNHPHAGRRGRSGP